MKKKYAFRKELIEVANKLGLYDENVLASFTSPISKKNYQMLVNNHRRFVKGMLKLSLAEQRLRLSKLKDKVTTTEASDSFKQFVALKEKEQENDSNRTGNKE